MKGLSIALTAGGGVLLLLMPTVILPICEYRGFPPMHCSETALAEYLIGALFIAAAAALFFLQKDRQLLVVESAAILLSVAAFVAPDMIGYCKSPQMPCHYGTVPAVKFVSAAAGLGLIISVMLRIASMRRKRSL